MEDPDRARAVVRAVRGGTDLPVTAKVRLGETLDGSVLTEFCRMLEGEGVDLITVHARLRSEPYGRPPRWERIAAVKQAVVIPVVANGGIFTVEDARRCLDRSGADGLMLGRGCVVRPWLFRDLQQTLLGTGARPHKGVSRPVIYSRFAHHLKRFPSERRLGRLKEFTHYFSQTYAFGHHLASAVQSSADLECALQRAQRFFAAHDAEPLR